MFGRERDTHLRTDIRLAGKLHDAQVLLHDAIDHGQTLSGAFAGLGGIIHIKNFRHGLSGNADAVIRYAYLVSIRIPRQKTSTPPPVPSLATASNALTTKAVKADNKPSLLP